MVTTTTSLQGFYKDLSGIPRNAVEKIEQYINDNLPSDAWWSPRTSELYCAACRFYKVDGETPENLGLEDVEDFYELFNHLVAEACALWIDGAFGEDEDDEDEEDDENDEDEDDEDEKGKEAGK